MQIGCLHNATSYRSLLCQVANHALLLLALQLVGVVATYAEAANINTQLEEDQRSIAISRAGLEDVITFLERHPEVIKPTTTKIPSAENRAMMLDAWQTLLDHLLALDVMGGRAQYLASHGPQSERDAEFELMYSIFLTQYRYVLEFLNHTEQSALLHTILNEAIPQQGIPVGSYAAIKYRYLNVKIASEFAWLNSRYASLKRPLHAHIQEDVDYILNVGEHRGVLLTVKNAGKIISDSLFSAWLPVQKGVSEWMGDTKVLRKNRSLISARQLKELQPKLEPGDILLVRREWYLSNIGLPGFWPHAALYIGSRDERNEYFSTADVRDWVISQGEASGEFERLIRGQRGDSYDSSMVDAHGDSIRVVEAISEGVSFTSFEHAAGGDSLVVLRPRRDKRIKAQAIQRAFSMAGRPYDFDFNFLTDNALVCTELVYKAYEGKEGLSLPLDTIMGRPVLPANRIAALFDAEYGRPTQQMDFIAFYDGHEWTNQAVSASLDEFRASWQRPKWHIFIQGMKSPKLIQTLPK